MLMIAHGTGLAPLRAMLFDMLDWEHRPRVHLFVSAEYPGELYDLMGLWNLAIVSSWLSVVPVVEHEEDTVGRRDGILPRPTWPAPAGRRAGR
ncbi:hypothetical protein QP028_09135 [Corynebacterium suedekumii]|nr:hypothetical protein QP028_09135 [Corynebacterium suedekumii]